MRLTRTAAGLLLLASLAPAQEPGVAAVLKRFDAAKPAEKEMGFFSLDWVCSLAEAKARARVEKRPVLVVLNTNITAHCDFYSGHT